MINIPNYQISTQIYESANSLVYRGVRKKDNQPVILKILKEDYPTSEELIRYRQEYEITYDLDLARIIKVYGIEKYQNTLIIVLEDFGGESLKQFITECHLTIIEFLPLAIQIADSLGNIHLANIIHKDINPSNIVLEPVSKELKIIDFGIASRLPRENPTLQNPEQLEGTLAYISPEQTGRMNRSLDYRTDLYSLGVTFYELLTGSLPFESDSAMELVHCHIAKTPKPVCEVNPDVPQIISDIVMKLMAKNVEERYQSAFGVKFDLEKVFKKIPPNPPFSKGGTPHFCKGGPGGILNFELAQNDFSGKLQIPQKLYGRESEINTLLQAFERVSGGSTEMMLVAGYSGVGKTALVHEVHKPMTEKYGYFAAGKFDQFQKNIPYSAITQAFNQFCRYLLMESAETLTNWQTKILNAVGNNGQIIIDVIPDLELVIGPQPAVAQVGPTETQNRFQMFFLNFVKVLCDKDHPFILFIDDLQWVDSASLSLLKSILLDDEIKHLFIIGAYRDNEVDSSHPFVMTMDELQKANAIINTIFLANLQPEDINQLLQDSLKCKSVLSQPLTDLIYQKTQGNAFFTHQFLHTLYDQALLRFDFIQLEWQWDVERIANQKITDNVVDLMAKKIDQLPSNTSKVLQLAACMGNQFELPILAIIYEQDQHETLEVLRPALAEGLIQPLDENYKHLDPAIKSQFKFSHDRVQQAAIALIDNEQKQAIHLKIGRLLLKNTSANALEDKIFDIVGQFNQSLELLKNQIERLEIARLNLKAGQKAKMATAYGAAINYLTIGRECLPDTSWKTEYDLTLNLFTEAVETTYLNGNFKQMEQLAQVVLQSARALSDEVKICEIQILAYVSQNQQLKAIKTALMFLNRLGISFSETPTQEEIGLALQEMQVALSSKSIQSLIDLPMMTNTNVILAMHVMVAVSSATYIALPRLMILQVLKQIDLSLSNGNISESSFSYVTYGVILCGVVSDIESGYQFGQLALNLLKRLDGKRFQASVIEIFNGLIRIWKEPVRETLPSLLESYQMGLETGNLEFVAHSLHVYLCHSYFIGKQLVILEQEMAQYSHVVAQIKQEGILNWIDSWWQAVLNLMGHSNNPSRLTGKVYDENIRLPLQQQANDRLGIHLRYLNKSILHYLFQEYAPAVEYAEKAEQYLDGVASMLPMAMFHVYDSLARLALYPNLSKPEQEAILTKVSANQQKMELWASHAPMNFQHKYDLVEAEKARVLGQDLLAMDLYEKAIAGALENEYLNEEALAYELAAKFYLGRNMDKFAQTYLKEAHYRYQRWGALAKVADLVERYPQWLAQESTPAMPTTLTSTATIMASTRTRTSTSLRLDLESVMKASQTLSGEIVLSQLLSKMMQIVIENAGAECGFLLLPQKEQWVIEAESAIDKEEITTLHSLPVENHLPEAIISYVAHTRETVVLANARQEGLYTENFYIKKHQTQSVLCFPIVYQQQLRAILYFENNLTTGAFTPQRLNVLKMLSSQIAISLENAQFTAYLETKVKERTAQLNAKVEELTQTRYELVQSEKMASLGRLVAGFAHELNTPLGVAIGSASALQRESQKINGLMEQDEVDVDELLSALDNIEKGFDLTLSNLERAANLVTSFKRTAVDQTEDEVRTFSVKELIHDTITTLHSHFKNTNLEISVDCPTDLKVKSLPGALEQILTNLLMNSLIHGFDEGKNAGAINLKVQLDGNHLHLEYSDTGKGIAPENLEKIFEPFFTTHRAHGGSGLGMYICYNLVTSQLHGTISCESVLNEGVVFKIEYPI